MNQQAVSESWRDRNECAKSPNATVSDLEILSRDDSGIIRSRVAQHPKTPVFVLERLAGERKDYYIRYYVALNRNATATILEKFANDPNAEIRAQCAKHPNTPTTILEKMADDSYHYVLLNVARNPNTPKKIKNYLMSLHYMREYK